MSGKEPITDELLNKLIQIILNKNTIEDTADVYFSNEIMIKNKVVIKYLDEKMSEKLRRCMYNKDCTKIGKPKEKTLTVEDIITILRAVLRKHGGYKLIGITDSNNIVKTRIYNIVAQNK